MLLQVFNAELAGYSAAIVYSLTSETLIVMSGHDGKLHSLLLGTGCVWAYRAVGAGTGIE